MAMVISVATIFDVEKALSCFKAAVLLDPALEGLSGKKLAAVVEGLTLKDGVTKDLNQAFNHGESAWAKNVLNGEIEGCTMDNKLDKIKQHVLQTSAYRRHIGDVTTKPKVEQWLASTFPTPTDETDAVSA